MKKYLLIIALLFAPSFALAQTCSPVTYSTPGNYLYTVPSNGFTVEVWGAGGGGSAAMYYFGSNGGDSTFSRPDIPSPVAGGGMGGQYDEEINDGSVINNGGTASGGTVNINGNGGHYSTPDAYGGAGGSAPLGGTGGSAGWMNGGAGTAPGAGGGGAMKSEGGGSGAYTSRTYAPGALGQTGSSVIVVVGAGGAGGGYSGGASYGGAGANGQVKISCGVADPCPIPIESPWGAGGYVLYAGATRRINFQGYNLCINNSSGYNYFVPGKTSAEIGSFYNAIPHLSVLNDIPMI